MSTLTVGPMALGLMHHFESCKLTAYRCPAGIPTIGWGMTYYPATGRRVQMGDRITQAQADQMFAALLEKDFAAPVRRLVAGVATTPAQFGAMVALAYNIGVGRDGFAGSTVLREHRAGNVDAAARAFAMWNRGGGKVLPGLVRRRAAEAALYRSDFAELARRTNGVVR